MLKSKLKRKLASILVAGLITVTTLGSGIAVAASGYQHVAGGEWSWYTVSGLYAKSTYYHRTRSHTASAQVGAQKVKMNRRAPGQTAIASSWGVGATRVWYGF